MSARTATRKRRNASTITTALLALLTALEGIPAGSPAGAAYTAALRRRGDDLAVAGGVEALRAAHAAGLDAAPACSMQPGKQSPGGPTEIQLTEFNAQHLIFWRL